MATRVTTKADDPATPDVDESLPFTDEQVNQLAAALQRVGPFVLGNDVRSEESSRNVARRLLEHLTEAGYKVPEPEPMEEPTPEPEYAATSSSSASSGTTTSGSGSSSS